MEQELEIEEILPMEELINKNLFIYNIQCIR